MVPRLLIAVTLLALGSCSLAPREPGNVERRFNEGDAANLIVRFYSWNSIQITRPDTRENGFLPLWDRDGVARWLAQTHSGRKLGVVVLGTMFSKPQEQDIIHQWHQLLDRCGFQRLVVLRAGFKDNINGLRVVYDSAINRADASPIAAPNVAGVAQVASPAGANVAHPPGAPVR